MTKLLCCASVPDQGNTEPLEIYLHSAAKIVETVAFEVATMRSPESVEELLGLAAGIEKAAGKLHEAG